MTDNWWQSAPLAPASDPSFTGYIPGTPKPAAPKEPKTQWKTLTAAEATAAGLDTGKVWQRSSEGEVKPVGTGEADPQKDLLGEAVKGLGVDELLASVRKARAAIKGGYATGITGSLLSHVPGTSAVDFRSHLQAIQGGIILEKMQALKDASKTGASGLGALSEKEGERLAASVAAVNPNMSDQELEASFKAIEQHANFLRAVQAGKDPRDPNVAREFGIGLVPAGADTGTGDNKPGQTSLTPDQQAKEQTFRATNPTPEAYASFLSNMLGKPVTTESAAARLNAAKKGAPYNPGVEDKPYEAKVQARIAAEDKLGLKDNAAQTLVVQGATGGLSDEASGIGNALSGLIAAPFKGGADPLGDYRLGRDVERQRIMDARQQLGYGGSALEFTGGLAMGSPGAGLAALAPRQAAIAAGRSGAVGGAVGGFGYGEGTESSVTGAGVGALAGYGIGRYGGQVAGAVADRVLPRGLRAPRGMAPDVAAAADAEGVDLIRPMVDPASRSEYGALESNRYSQPTIRAAAERTRGQIEGRVGDLATGGVALEPDAAGGIVQTSGSRFIQRSRAVADRLYNRARTLAGDTRFEPTQALAQVDAELGQLQANPETNAGEINFLNGLRRDLATPGGKTVEELRQLRTSLRGRVTQENLTATQAEARAIRAMDATQQDVAANVPQAASAFRRADSYYRERQTHIDDIIKRITGGNVGNGSFQVSGEQAFQRLKSMASPNGDGRRLGALMRDLEPSERQDIAATIAQGLGRDAPDQPFSAAKFISHTNKLSPSARRTIFGPDGAQSIQNLRLLSQRLKEAGADINQSRSATVLERSGIRTAAHSIIGTLTGLGGYEVGGIMGGVTGAGVALAAMGASAARKTLSARAMVNPRVSRWLAEAANVSTQSAAQRVTAQLGTIIRREPALANELQPVYDMLQQRLTARLSAQGEGQQNDQ